MKILTHWDADGIISASKVLEVIDGEVYIPRIGTWRFEAIPREALKGTLYVLDYSLPREDWEKVCEMIEDLVIIDHHTGNEAPCGKTINPALRGIEVPACSLVVSNYFRIPYDWRDAVAIAADLGDPAGNPFWVKIVKEQRLNEEDIMEAAALLNSCYRTLDYECIKEYAYNLRQMELEEVLNDKRLRANRERARSRLEEYLRKANCVGRVCLIRGDEDVHLFASALWKRLKRNGVSIVITINEKMMRIYCRGDERDYEEAIRRAKQIGLKEVGGKKEVCSAHVTREELPRVIRVLREMKLLDEFEFLESSVIEH
ncbi:hypothetical protein EYM_02290 [Ignicoccus islandicus DSM 13165]|uniref:Phosphoesterase n=1 Tax=Ignicoccus islandicus DSM 13165 TaxID=940295 RepID=A0A0U2U895_9CREN|nr:DHH family phosphoesterase [Ignicoccus islandicus]ALU12308.1 hypothetical protein EYM_02290 [Ignicoccus islandicus DSM 13165]